MTAPALPEATAGLYLGGGFPEVYAEDLAANASLRADVAAAVASGLPTVAECAGLLYLADSLDGTPHGRRAADRRGDDAAADARLPRGHRRRATPCWPAPASGRARHEFHRTGVTLARRDLGRPRGRSATRDVPRASPPTRPASARRPCTPPTSTCTGPGPRSSRSGSPRPRPPTFDPAAAGGRPPRLLRRCTSPCPVPAGRRARPPLDGAVDLDHHGDRDTAPGLIDLAVNVRTPAPAWLIEADHRPGVRLGRATPTPADARAALAVRHGVDEAWVLPTSGAAEAFTLIARGLRRRPAPSSCTRSSPRARRRCGGPGVRVAGAVGRAEDGFALDPAGVPRGRRSGPDRQPDQPDRRAARGRAAARARPARTRPGGRRGVHGLRPRASRSR